MVDQENATGKSVYVYLQEFDKDRKALMAQLLPGYQRVWFESLKCIEEILPDRNSPGSSDSRLYSAMRHRILDVGNAVAREAERIMQCFAVKEVIERKVVERVELPTHGVFKLPDGVKMPSEKPNNKPARS